jgi:hypothetical protein
MDESNVRTYVEQSQSLLKNDPQMGEPNTRAKLIRPLIDLLGWDILTDVELEYSIQIGTNTIRADYAFLLEDTPVVMVEAKACTRELTDSDEKQLRSYMVGESVNWGLLTNGRQLRILHRQKNRDRPEVLSSLSLNQLVDEGELLRCLSKEFIETGEADNVVERRISKKQAIDELRNNKQNIADKVMQTIVDEVDGLRLQEIETESKEFIDDLVSSLTQEKEEVNGLEGDYIVSLRKDGEQVRQFAGKHQIDAMEQTVNYLIQDQGLLDELELPYMPGRTRPILSTEPTDRNGQRITHIRELPDGTYLNVALNADDKQKFMGEFSEMCGPTIEFSGSW